MNCVFGDTFLVPVFVVKSVFALSDAKLLFKKLLIVVDGFVGFLLVYD